MVREFDAVGPYERVHGTVLGELDPTHPLNTGIVNLDRAARNVPWLSVETPMHASVYQVLRNERVLFERAALLSMQEALA